MVLLKKSVVRDKALIKSIYFKVLFICGLFYIACLKIEWKFFIKKGSHVKLYIVDKITFFSQFIAS